MKTSDPYAEAYAKAARAAERCQYHTPTGRQCACLIQDPQSKFCPRHSESPSVDTRNFARLLAENAENFQSPEGINHSLAHLFRLLAGGHISTRRATGLAYIASLVLRTLPAMNNHLPGSFVGVVPARGRVGMPPDEEDPNPPEASLLQATAEPANQVTLHDAIEQGAAAAGRPFFVASHFARPAGGN